MCHLFSDVSISSLCWPHSGDYQALPVLNKGQFQQIFTDNYSVIIRTLDYLFRTQDHTPAMCSCDSTVAVAQTRNLTDTRMVKCGFTRNMQEDHRRQMDDERKRRNMGKILAEKIECVISSC